MEEDISYYKHKNNKHSLNNIYTYHYCQNCNLYFALNNDYSFQFFSKDLSKWGKCKQELTCNDYIIKEIIE